MQGYQSDLRSSIDVFSRTEGVRLDLEGDSLLVEVFMVLLSKYSKIAYQLR